MVLSKLAVGLDAIRRTGSFCDVEVVAVGATATVTFFCHRIVLASACFFFSAALTPSYTEHARSRIVLHFDADVVEALIHYCYTRAVNLDADLVTRLVVAADFVGLLRLKEECQRWLISSLIGYATPDFCLSLLPFASRYTCTLLRQFAVAAAVTHIRCVSECASLGALSLRDLTAILTACNVNLSNARLRCCEEWVYRCVVAWLRAETRSDEDKKSALSLVRWSCLSREFLSSIVFHELCVPLSYSRELETAPVCSRVRAAPHAWPVTVGEWTDAPRLPSRFTSNLTVDSGRGVVYAGCHYKIWALQPCEGKWRLIEGPLDMMDTGYWLHHIDGKMYSIAKDEFTVHVHEFDADAETWKEVRKDKYDSDEESYFSLTGRFHSKLLVERKGCIYQLDVNHPDAGWSLLCPSPFEEYPLETALVEVDSRLYAIGGDKPLVRVLDSLNGEWSVAGGNKDEDEERECGGACAWRKALVVAGGCHWSDGKLDKNEYLLDGTWHPLPPLSRPGDCHLATLDDVLYTVYGDGVTKTLRLE